MIYSVRWKLNELSHSIVTTEIDAKTPDECLAKLGQLIGRKSLRIVSVTESKAAGWKCP